MNKCLLAIIISDNLVKNDLMLLFLFEIRKFIERYGLNEINDPIHVCSTYMSRSTTNS
jgi:hypothetical protein